MPGGGDVAGHLCTPSLALKKTWSSYPNHNQMTGFERTTVALHTLENAPWGGLDARWDIQKYGIGESNHIVCPGYQS
jgi:hypothetical protein